jgi:class 3 adenylate cyclase
MRPASKLDRIVDSDRIVKAGLDLMHDAETNENLSQFERTLQYRNGLMIAFLAFLPLRLKNFASLKIGVSLFRVDENWHVVIPASETKSGRAEERKVPNLLQPFLTRYINTHRRPLRLDDSGLWISCTDRALNYKSCGRIVTETTRKILGVPISPHLFMACAASMAYLYAGDQPHLAAGVLQPDLSPNATRDVAAALNLLLADAFALYLKTKNFHWHMSGPHFRDNHRLLDEQAEQIFATTDAPVVAVLDAWFDRIAGAVHAFGGEVLKFIGDGVLAIFPIGERPPSAACDAALSAVGAARAGMAHLDQARGRQGLAPLPFGMALHLGDMLWGNIGTADRLDFTAIGPAVNLVGRLEGLCRPLGRSVLASGAVAAVTTTALIPLGEHLLRGIATPCAVFTLPEDWTAPSES